MLKSMTGYGKVDVNDEIHHISVEIRAVNSRFCEINIYMPKILNQFELNFRKIVCEKINRGKIDVNIEYKNHKKEEYRVSLNKPLATALKLAIEELEDTIQRQCPWTHSDLLRYNDLLTVEHAEENMEEVGERISLVLKESLEHLMLTRLDEGHNLQLALEKNLENIQKNIEEIKICSANMLNEYKERLEIKLRNSVEQFALGELSEERILSELVIYSDKVDITEELNRLDSHIDLFNKAILDKTVPVKGKRLDFILQEMNREVNTIGSKANNKKIVEYVVALKCEIEKMREQTQNIE